MKILIGATLGVAGLLLAIAWWFRDDPYGDAYADIDNPDLTEIPDLTEPGSNGS